MTAAHWLYVLGVVVVLVVMGFRRNVVIPCTVFTFLVALAFTGDFVASVQALFNAMLVAATELFGIFLIISVMVAMLKAMQASGADSLMVAPLKRLMVSPLVSYVVLVLATFVISMFFWPTPSVPLVGGLLVPAAVAVGLPPVIGAVAVALAGQGMALAGDLIIQGAPGLTASAAGVDVGLVVVKAGILTLVTGAVAIPLAYYLSRNEIRAFAQQVREVGVAAAVGDSYVIKEEALTDPSMRSTAVFLARLTPVLMLLAILGMIGFNILGGDATALLGGTAVVILVVGALMTHKANGLDEIADYLGEGLTFAFKVMGPIIPIAGFFFLGGPETVVRVLGEGAPGFLFDIGRMVSRYIPATGVFAKFGLLIVGMITGLDGSGFSGLPLVGGLAGSLAGGSAQASSTLGAVGQIGAVWCGGGTLVAWSTLVAVAGICGVPVMDVLRKNVVPVLCGLLVATLVAALVL